MGCALVTYCSKDKDRSAGLMAAEKRYKSKRIAETIAYGVEQGIAVYIHSGRFGLVRPTVDIPYYDYLLWDEDVSPHIDLLLVQLRSEGITSVVYVVGELTEQLSPYIQSMAAACYLQSVTFTLLPLSKLTKET